MGWRGDGQIRRSQVITTYGPGALIDLPQDSGIIGGLECWPKISELEEVHESRLARKLETLTDVSHPRLYAPPAATDDPREKPRRIAVWRFPEWYVVREAQKAGRSGRSRRLVHRGKLEKRRFEGLEVVPTRFVRACPRGHVDDLNWYTFVHTEGSKCRRQLWLDEKGTSGDLGDLTVRCECGARRGMQEAGALDMIPLGHCNGRRPWLGRSANEECGIPSRLLIRTASNAYFPQVYSVLSLPDRGSGLQQVVEELWGSLRNVEELGELRFVKKDNNVAERLAPYDDEEVLDAIEQRKSGRTEERPTKVVELDAILAAEEGYGDDIPVKEDFHARKLPDKSWRKTKRFPGIESVIQLHRLREVMALLGFSRLEAVVPGIDGEFDTDVQRASLALEPEWFPAVENRGEGIFVQLDATAVKKWLERPAVKARIDDLQAGLTRWNEDRGKKEKKEGSTAKRTARKFPGGPYILLHTLSHLLIESMSMRCGYPASSIRERIYADGKGERYGILLYTGSPDADGTLGGLVQEARNIELHLAHALRSGALCSNDPICAQHEPGKSLENRFLQGAACHGCALVAETSCEMRNDFLDRALVVPVLGNGGAAFFEAAE
ncbi:MAG: DUF1998 domain-containing protein [Planctomycetota bacterium]